MEPVDFVLAPANTPDGEYLTLARNQRQYLPLHVFRTPEGRVISAWQPTAEELAALNRGEQVWLQVATFNQPFHPVRISVGEPQLVQVPGPIIDIEVPDGY